LILVADHLFKSYRLNLARRENAAEDHPKRRGPAWQARPTYIAAIIALNVNLGKRGKGQTEPAQFGGARV
jgi:hypothetical protein